MRAQIMTLTQMMMLSLLNMTLQTVAQARQCYQTLLMIEMITSQMV